MKPPILKEDKSSPLRSKDIKNRPELQPVRPAPAAEQMFAKELVKMQAENSGKLLILRSRALLAVTVLTLMSVALNAFYVIPVFLRDQADIAQFLFACSMVLHLSSAGYFLRAKDPEFAAQIIRLMLIINGVVLLMGFMWLGSLLLTLAILVLMFIAYKRMGQLKYGGD